MEYGLAPTNANIWTCSLASPDIRRIFNSLGGVHIASYDLAGTPRPGRRKVLISFHFSASHHTCGLERGCLPAGRGEQDLGTNAPSSPQAGPCPHAEPPMEGEGRKHPQGAEPRKVRGPHCPDPETRGLGDLPLADVFTL